MKKTFIVLAVMLVTSIAAKAWKVGDFYDQDPTGVPAVVVYVDESGEHGLIMSPQAFTDKQVKTIHKNSYYFKKSIYDKSMFKGGINDKYEYMRKEKTEEERLAFKEYFNRTWDILYNYICNISPKISETKIKSKDKTKIESVAVETTENGEDNQKAIANYCIENGIDIGTYFPAFEWAANLGEGWFIPGNAELEQFAQIFVEGMGQKNKIHGKDKQKRERNWNEKLGAGAAWIGNSFDVAYPIDGIMSSTMVKSSWGETAEHKAYTYGNISNSLYYHLRWIVRKIDAAWWIEFDKTWDASSKDINSIVAFKRF